MAELTHFNEQGRARMVDVTGKAVTHRTAVASGEGHMAADTLERIKSGRADIAKLDHGDAEKIDAKNFDVLSYEDILWTIAFNTGSDAMHSRYLRLAMAQALDLEGAGSYLPQDEVKGVKAVLSAAALTYVAAALQAVLQLLRLVILAGGRRRDD